MIGAIVQWFARLPTAAKLLLILTLAILPIGLALVWVAQSGINNANSALMGRADDQATASARAMESLIARNALALRIAANGALAQGPQRACERARRSLSIAPGVAQTFSLENPDGAVLCAVGRVAEARSPRVLAPGDIRLRVAEDPSSLVVRVGVIAGRATGVIPVRELRTAALERGEVGSVVLSDGALELTVLEGPADNPERRSYVREYRLGNGQLTARVSMQVAQITTFERLLLLLPLLMWVMAALVTWLLVTRLLIRPLRMLERSVSRLEPGTGGSALPRKLGPSTEIQQLRDAFARGLDRIEQSEREMGEALEGQRRLVREVHHRVKNNLQVVASLLNIHGRSAESAEAKSAYAGMGRRVGALSIVHRNHFAEMEENRGISLRPLLAELTAELRAGAPEAARGLAIELEVESANTTQDVAVSVAFLVTEIVEFAMLNRPRDPVEISLRRTSDLTARLTLSSPVLVPDDADRPEKVQFERIIGGLAKQLRSTLDRRLGRYSVDLPVFPAD